MMQQPKFSYEDLEFNDVVFYRQAILDRRYEDEASSQPLEDGPYQAKIVDFLNEYAWSPFSRVGVRTDGLNGTAPLYYVQLQDILAHRKRDESGDTLLYARGKDRESIRLQLERCLVTATERSYKVADFFFDRSGDQQLEKCLTMASELSYQVVGTFSDTGMNAMLSVVHGDPAIKRVLVTSRNRIAREEGDYRQIEQGLHSVEIVFDGRGEGQP
jgi:hypothetical protein